jgi:hypothetical protein
MRAELRAARTFNRAIISQWNSGNDDRDAVRRIPHAAGREILDAFSLVEGGWGISSADRRPRCRVLEQFTSADCVFCRKRAS